MIEDPLTPATALLVLLAPGVWLAGRRAAGRLTRDPTLRLALGGGLGLAGWLVAVHALATACGSFPAGLWLGTLAVGGLGLGLEVAHRTGRMERWAEPEPDADAPVPNRRALLVGVVVAMAVAAPLAFGWGFHDEQFVVSHTSIPARMQNGPYPLTHGAFPAHRLRYHIGFDLLTAAVSGALRIPPVTAIDVVTILSFGATCALLWVLGLRLLGAGGGWLTALLVLGAGGLALPGLGIYAGLPPTFGLLQAGLVEGVVVHPSTVSYLFQHPWAVGLPLALTALLLLSERREPPGAGRAAAFALLLLALSISQVVLFAALGGALLVAESWRDGRLDRRRALGIAAAVGAAGVLAAGVPLAWFFNPPYAPGGAGLGLRAGFASPGGMLVWHLYSFGLLLPLGLIGLARLPRERLVFAILLLGSVLCYTLIVYAHSWDIFKFAVPVSLCLAVGAAALLHRGLRAERRAVRIAAWVAIPVFVSGGLSFATALTLRLPDIPPQFQGATPAPTGDDAAAIDWLRERVGPRASVYRRQPLGLAYAQHGGLAIPWTDANDARHGFAPQQLAYREWLLERLPDDPAAFRHQGVRWLVLGPEDQRLARFAGAWVAAGAAREATRCGALTIYRLEGPLYGPAPASVLRAIGDPELRAWVAAHPE